jgi:hypothetical protein
MERSANRKGDETLGESERRGRCGDHALAGDLPVDETLGESERRGRRERYYTEKQRNGG